MEYKGTTASFIIHKSELVPFIIWHFCTQIGVSHGLLQGINN